MTTNVQESQLKLRASQRSRGCGRCRWDRSRSDSRSCRPRCPVIAIGQCGSSRGGTGASYALCEVMLDQFLLQVRNRQRTRHFLHLSDDERPVGRPVDGSGAGTVRRRCQRLVQAGFDVIDINFGCPVKKVLGKCRGGYHLSQPDVALDVDAPHARCRSRSHAGHGEDATWRR